MGTSTWHKSPATQEWDWVRELYAQPNPDPREVVRRIVAALDPETRERMKAPAVVTCLSVLLEGSQRVAEHGMTNTLAGLGVGTEPPALQMAAGLRNRAGQLIAQEEYASRFGDVALDAVGTTAMALATLDDAGASLLDIPLAVAEANFAGFDREERFPELAATFLRHDLDLAFRHFIARDMSNFIGGEGIPTVGHASRFEDAASRYCREGLDTLDLGRWSDALAESPSLTVPERVQVLTPVISAGIDAALGALGGVA